MGGTRSVVKANYRPAGGAHAATARASMKASARYYEGRPNELGERQVRLGFDAEYDGLERSEVLERIEQSKGEYAYRAVLSPGEDLKGYELEEWTRDVMREVGIPGPGRLVGGLRARGSDGSPACSRDRVHGWQARALGLPGHA